MRDVQAHSHLWERGVPMPYAPWCIYVPLSWIARFIFKHRMMVQFWMLYVLELHHILWMAICNTRWECSGYLWDGAPFVSPLICLLLSALQHSGQIKTTPDKCTAQCPVKGKKENKGALNKNGFILTRTSWHPIEAVFCRLHVYTSMCTFCILYLHYVWKGRWD